MLPVEARGEASGGVRRLPGAAVAGLASLGAGGIHAAAAGVHAENPQLAQLFVVTAILQAGAGVWLLLRPGRVAAMATLAVNLGAVVGWLATRLTGVSWIDGLEAAEAPRFADTACALLGTVAVAAAGAGLLVGSRTAHKARLLVPALAVAVLAVPAMVSAGSNVHSHDATDADHSHGEAAGTADGAGPGAASDEAHTHDTIDEATADEATAEGTTDSVHTHPTDTSGTGEAAEHSHDSTAAASTTWPRPWDPAAGIDLSGVEGVSAEQEARATALVEQTLVDLPQFADPAVAEAAGYRSIGDASTGNEHLINAALVEDGVLLDPSAPESLVYAVADDGSRTLTGAMFIAGARPVDDPSLTDWAGPLMQWHVHDNLCVGLGSDGRPAVVGLSDDAGNCARGIRAEGTHPMVHVWITPHQCGVFAALEGAGAGTAAVSDDQRRDMCAQDHSHSDSSTVSPVPYDPSRPIDLGGVPGVTAEQQAAAENLVAVNVVRLPQWADYHVAEAAGFTSIGDGRTGHEHYIKWEWINDDVILDPDQPESLVYEPQPDGSKKLVSAMYMLPDTVALGDAPDIGGALMQWHIHDDLCFTPSTPRRVVGQTAGDGTCRAPLEKLLPSAMIHVWITPHPCGPFAALEGTGAGQIEEGATRLCDHAHGSR
jgi:hypothetical protein